MGTKLTVQAQRSKEKKEHIYRTAMQMFKHHGYEATTIRDICREAGISNSTFYHFFGDKSGLLLEFYRQLFQERAAYLNHSPENLSHPFQAIFNYLFHAAQLQDLMGKEFAREIMFNNPFALAGPDDSFSRQSSMLQIAGFIQAAVDAGTLSREVHPWYTAEYLMSGANGVIFTWFTSSGSESASSMMKRLLPVTFRAVTDESLTAQEEPR